MAGDILRRAAGLDIAALHDGVVDDGLPPTARQSTPTTDIYTEDDGALVIETHLPNFDEEDIAVTFDSAGLVIAAEAHATSSSARKEYVMRESATSLRHAIALPEQFDVGGISADFNGGVLRIRVPLAVGSAQFSTPSAAADGEDGFPATGPNALVDRAGLTQSEGNGKGRQP